MPARKGPSQSSSPASSAASPRSGQLPLGADPAHQGGPRPQIAALPAQGSAARPIARMPSITAASTCSGGRVLSGTRSRPATTSDAGAAPPLISSRGSHSTPPLYDRARRKSSSSSASESGAARKMRASRSSPSERSHRQKIRCRQRIARRQHGAAPVAEAKLARAAAPLGHPVGIGQRHQPSALLRRGLRLFRHPNCRRQSASIAGRETLIRSSAGSLALVPQEPRRRRISAALSRPFGDRAPSRSRRCRRRVAPALPCPHHHVREAGCAPNPAIRRPWGAPGWRRRRPPAAPAAPRLDKAAAGGGISVSAAASAIPRPPAPAPTARGRRRGFPARRMPAARARSAAHHSR